VTRTIALIAAALAALAALASQHAADDIAAMPDWEVGL
jgi:hypothetical protein